MLTPSKQPHQIALNNIEHLISDIASYLPVISNKMKQAENEFFSLSSTESNLLIETLGLSVLNAQLEVFKNLGEAINTANKAILSKQLEDGTVLEPAPLVSTATFVEKLTANKKTLEIVDGKMVIVDIPEPPIISTEETPLES